MKAISVKQPWASLIVNGVKDIENRTWKCPEKYIGQRVLIHASMGWNKDLAEICLGDLVKRHLENLRLIHRYDDEETGYKGYSFSFPHGAIIGSVKIVDSVVNHSSIWAEKSKGFSNGYENGIPSRYAIKKEGVVFNWILANPILFEQPIPCKGKLGYFEVEL